MSRKLIGAIALLLLGMVAVVVYKMILPKMTQPAPTNVQNAISASDTITISFASSNTKEDWLRQVTELFVSKSKSNAEYQVDGHPIQVEIIKEIVDGKKKDYRSGTMVKDTLSGKIKPTVISPGEESWVAKFVKEYKALYNINPVNKPPQILVRTPIVIAMWQSRAKALDCYPDSTPSCTWNNLKELALNPAGWEHHDRPEWNRFTFGYGYFGESNSGTLGVLSMCMVGAGKQQGLSMDDVAIDKGCGKFMGAIEGAKVHSGKSDIWLLERMITGGQDYLDAVITYESNVIAMNRKYANRLPEPLVCVYPQDGTVVVGHPYAILDSVPWVTQDQISAANIFRDFLLEPSQQETVLSLGLRPADSSVKLKSPISPDYGANPSVKLTALEVPETLVMDHVGEVWKRVKKKAVIVIIFDKSGSMKDEGKIIAARMGAKEFVGQMGPDDVLIWLPFDSRIYSGRAEGPKHMVGEDLINEINSITAGGETALYDTILTGMDKLKNYQNKYGNTMRYGMIVLSDGRDSGRGSTLSQIESQLIPQEGNPLGVQIHTICIGSDCDEPVLSKIANIAHGRFWKGRTEKDMVNIYHNIATHY